ncbi:MAG: nucleoside-triphosphatase [Candidatus Izemoplasmatales bacterium]
MVTIVTGGIDSCKTTKLTSLFAESGKGDGFAMIKRLAGRHVRGYDARRLSTGVEIPLVHRRGFEPEGLAVACEIGPYLFARESYDRVVRELTEMVAARTSPIYFDEIGELELSGSGFDDAIAALAASGLDLVLVVRDEFVERAIARYGFRNATVVDSI